MEGDPKTFEESRAHACLADIVLWIQALTACGIFPLLVQGFWLQGQGEDDLVASYQRNYFELSPDNRWTSDCAGGMDNCAAGFYVGSQPQESWHKNRLRPALGDMRLEAAEVVSKLGEMMDSRTSQAELRQELWWDVPTGAWSRSHVDAGSFVLKNTSLFAKQGNAWCMRTELNF